MLFIYFKAYYKAGWRAGILLLSIPYCQWQYSTAYATRVSTKLYLLGVVKRCTVLLLPVSVISYPRKMFKQLSNNLPNLVSIMRICCMWWTLFRLLLRLVIVAAEYAVCFAFHEIAGRCPGEYLLASQSRIPIFLWWHNVSYTSSCIMTEASSSWA